MSQFLKAIKKIRPKQWLGATGILLGLVLLWLATTDNSNIWPIRNTLQYRVLTWWWAQAGYPQSGPPGILRGTIRDAQGNPIAGAWVLASRWDGTTYRDHSQTDGTYTISDMPAGQYRPVAGAPGHASVMLGGWGKVTITAGAATTIDVVLPEANQPAVSPGRELVLGEPSPSTCAKPIEATATRRQVTFESAGQPNQLTFLYTPLTATTTSPLPILLTIYPGPAGGWECASLPLAAAGYVVVATGPAYSFDLERNIDELERLIAFARAGSFPAADGRRIALLGGSYSSLHVQRMLQRDPGVKAAVLLGPLSDLFDMRRRLEEGTFIPPYDLDRAMIALGLPDREPLRYWRYSGAYHVRPDFPPLVVMHSRTDDIVPFQQSEFLSANLTKAGVLHDTYFFEGASHYLLDESGEGEAIYQITLEFLAKHLQ